MPLRSRDAEVSHVATLVTQFFLAENSNFLPRLEIALLDDVIGTERRTNPRRHWSVAVDDAAFSVAFDIFLTHPGEARRRRFDHEPATRIVADDRDVISFS